MAYDDAEEAEVAEQRKIKVEGMTCSGCEQRVNRSLEQLDGVRDVTADHRAGEVRITFDPVALSYDVVEGRIREAGYRVPA